VGGGFNARGSSQKALEILKFYVFGFNAPQLIFTLIYRLLFLFF